MSFDDQLRHAFDSLTDQLRDDIARQVRAVVDELATAAKTERDRAADEAARTSGDAARTAADAQIAEARTQFQSAELTARERLLAAIRAMDRARSLTEIFDALSLGAEREAARVAILLVRDTALRSWRFSGFDPALDRSHDIELALERRGVIGEAIGTLAAAASDGADRPASAPFDLPVGRTRVAVPISISGQIVAVLYADEGSDPQRAPGPGWPAAIEILALHAARSLEALTAFKSARVLSERRAVQPISSFEGADRAV